MPPNILWIVTTQWRAQALGHAGDANARTPAMDALADAGVSYTQAVTPHPFGPQARAALLTGVRSPANGIRDYFDPLPVGARTLARELNGRSYATAFLGKWHLASRDRGERLVGDAHARMVVPEANRGGFTFWEGFESGFQLNNPWLHGTRLPEPVRFEGYQSDVVCRRALETLGFLPSPWFAVVSLEAPHPPYDAPCPGPSRRDPSLLLLRGNVPGDPGVQERARRELSGYYAHIEATDRAIGSLVGALPTQTLVVATSVHGDMHGSHGLFRKGWPHEESIRVPLVVRGPVDRRFRHAPVSLVELPSLARAWADGLDGWSPPQSSSRISMPTVVPLPDQCDRVWDGIRTVGRKLVTDGSGAPWLYFNLESDPLELSNLVGDPRHAEEIRSLLGQLTP